MFLKHYIWIVVVVACYLVRDSGVKFSTERDYSCDWIIIMKSTEVGTGDWWEEYQTSSPARRHASGKLWKCPRHALLLARADPRRVMSGKMEEFCNGQRDRGAEQKIRDSWSKIKSKHSPEQHTRGPACSTSIGVDHLDTQLGGVPYVDELMCVHHLQPCDIVHNRQDISAALSSDPSSDVLLKNTRRFEHITYP